MRARDLTNVLAVTVEDAAREAVMRDAAEVRRHYGFFAALRAENGDARFCEVVQELYGNVLKEAIQA